MEAIVYICAFIGHHALQLTETTHIKWDREKKETNGNGLNKNKGNEIHNDHPSLNYTTIIIVTKFIPFISRMIFKYIFTIHIQPSNMNAKQKIDKITRNSHLHGYWIVTHFLNLNFPILSAFCLFVHTFYSHRMHDNFTAKISLPFSVQCSINNFDYWK